MILLDLRVKKYFLIIKWSLVCKNTATKSLLQTMFFVGTYFVFIVGILSDKYGRKKVAFYMIVANGLLHILMTVLLNIKSLDRDVEVTLFISKTKIIISWQKRFFPIY
jgi:MFS family permease